MPGTVEQTWTLQPARENMQTLASPRQEDAEAAGGGSGSSTTAQKTTKTFTQAGTVSWLFHSMSPSEWVLGRKWAECGTSSNRLGFGNSQ